MAHFYAFRDDENEAALRGRCVSQPKMAEPAAHPPQSSAVERCGVVPPKRRIRQPDPTTTNCAVPPTFVRSAPAREVRSLVASRRSSPPIYQGAFHQGIFGPNIDRKSPQPSVLVSMPVNRFDDLHIANFVCHLQTVSSVAPSFRHGLGTGRQSFKNALNLPAVKLARSTTAPLRRAGFSRRLDWSLVRKLN